ncbi:MAG: hypothetical protein II972_05645, partial [Elusimicrobiaceae bacterium]|nr:hypothetical protein [Elusimicrobiaceae bacterium]
KKTEILKGRYNYVVLDKDKSFVRVFGAGIKGDILRSALLTLGTKQIDCLFVKGSASSLYALKDLEDIKIKKIYLEQDFINDKAEKLLKNTETKINFIWPQQEYCGVRVLKEENLNLSFNTEKIKVFDNLKKIVIEGKEKNFKEEKQTI